MQRRPGSGPAGADGPADDGLEAPSVRPYMVTGGRTRPSGADLPVEALVERLEVPDPVAAAPPGAGGAARAALRASLAGPESRRILDLLTDRYLSVAELSAHAHLPVGVVRVLVADLADAGRVRVHGLTAAAVVDPTDPSASAAALAVLESVLDGISAL